MTDEDRCQKLVPRLHQARMASHSFKTLHDLCEDAADEIKRLAKENKFLQLQLNGLRDLWAERDADRPKPLPNLNSTSLQRDLPIKRS